MCTKALSLSLSSLETLEFNLGKIKLKSRFMYVYLNLIVNIFEYVRGVRNLFLAFHEKSE